MRTKRRHPTGGGPATGHEDAEAVLPYFVKLVVKVAVVFD
jgi:hypothetical protein